ncbi:MAG: META domain-containing protein, partial [Treponema sp.]|nr:META domain-containing protein [Treponema sp.]
VAVGDGDFSDVMDRYWILSQIRTAYETVTLDRDNHAALGFGDIFTLRFEGGMVFGTAMPNTYRGPYTLGENRYLAFGLMATTMMAAFMEPEEITEHQFFVHLGNVVRWYLVDGNLSLHAIDEYYAKTILVFALLED